MKKVSSRFKATGLLILLAIFFGFSSKTDQNSSVMIYGIVYNDHCNSEAFEHFTSKLVSSENYYKEQQSLESYLKKEYPNARKIRTGSSKFDYSTATNMCVIKWQSGSSKCAYDVVSVLFGKKESEALNNAINHKNKWAGSNVNYTIVKQTYWQ